MATKQQCYTQDGDKVSTSGTGRATSSAATSSKTPSTSSKQSATTTTKNRNSDGIMSSFSDAVESAASSIDKTTAQINAVDCSDKLYDYIQEHVPAFATAMNFVDMVSGNHTLSVDFSLDVASLVGSTDFGKTVCAMLQKFFGSLTGMLDIALKSAFVLFKRIDAARERLENATLSFTAAIRTCVLDVINAITDKLFASFKLELNLDWDAMLDLMLKCPCITKIIAKLIHCDKDANGRDISNDPYAVLDCVKSSAIFANPLELNVAVGGVIGKFLRSMINKIFGKIEAWIKYVFKFLIKPFRKLIKAYAKLLTKKINVDVLIKTVGVYRCFFSYTEEYKHGKKYYGMSVIDILNTFKIWIGCLELICSNFTEKVKNYVKQMYKDLRLDDKYWRRAQEADIYNMCIAAELDSSVSRDSVLRSLYGNDPWDDLMSMFKKAKNNDDKTSDDKQLALDFDLSQAFDLDTLSGSAEPSAISQAISFTSAPESENEVVSGIKPITSREEDALKRMGTTLSTETGDPYYTEHFYQLIRFGNNYATSNEYLLHMNAALEQTEHLTGNFNESSNSTLNNSGRRQPDFTSDPMGHDNPVLPTYEVKSDFNEARYEKIASAKFGEQGKNESLVDYYVRMYNTAKVSKA